MNTKIQILALAIISLGANYAKADDNIEHRIANLEARLTRIEQRQISLPTQAAQPEKKKDIVIHVAADGSILLEHQKSDIAELTAKLKELGSNQPNTRIVVIADKKTDTQHIVDICNSCRAAVIDPNQVSLGWESGK